MSRNSQMWRRMSLLLLVDWPQMMGMNRGLKEFGSDAEAAISKELMQLHNMEAFVPVYGRDLSPEQKKGALESIMTMKQKRDGKIKGRHCADGRKQRAQ